MAQVQFQGPVFAVDPSVSDDASLGWGPGATWINSATKHAYVCISNAIGAAVWECVTDFDTATVGTALVAAGTVQADALAITADVNVIGTAAAGTGVRLPTGKKIGSRMVIKNRGANTANIFPATGGTVNAGAANAAITVAAAAVVELIQVSTNNWEAC